MKKAEIVQLFSLIDKINTDDLVDNVRICIVRNYMLLSVIVDELEKYKIKVTNFTPDNKTQILRDRLPRLDSLRTSITYTASK